MISHPNSAVIFLGDNSYKDDLGESFHSVSKDLTVLKTRWKKSDHNWVFWTSTGDGFISHPGNHDWWNRTTYQRGKDKLAMEESFIKSNLKLNTSIANPDKTFLPAHGDYGPEYVELNHQTIRLVFFDSYRIIQTGIKKSKPPEEEKTFYHRLDSIIHAGYALKEQIVVVSHHPVYLKGPYDRNLKHPYLFARIKASNSNFPSYKIMIDSLQKVLKRYPGIYYVSGHVHALQYFYTNDSLHYVISGAGSKEIKLSPKKASQYEASILPDEYLLWNTGGFFELDYRGDKMSAILYFNNGSLKCTIP